MYCNKCGNAVEPNEMYCGKCGNPLHPVNNINPNTFIEPHNYKSKPKINKRVYLFMALGVAFIFMIGGIISSRNNNDFYFSNDTYSGKEEDEPSKSKAGTIIKYDNVYSNDGINTEDDAENLIIDDSVKQKSKCPAGIKSIEDRIINNYGVLTVNLCEINLDFAKEIEGVVKRVYDEFPTARNYLTNLTINNAPKSYDYIAAYCPASLIAPKYAYEDDYPLVYKMYIVLNSKYFLNIKYLEAGVKSSVDSHHFPPNSNRYSVVAHEFGHYLSFIASMKYYNANRILLVNGNNLNSYYQLLTAFNEGSFSLKIITEAYNNYKAKNSSYNKSLLEFRESISKYAVTKDNKGEYIYDESISESFQDYYVNGNKASDAAKEIIAVLKKYLEME